ncbi:MAG TPA: RcnB family protein [Rhizomicrobium sp.]|nr:RcnB family protein [Rhizomicrobium sp.]
MNRIFLAAAALALATTPALADPHHDNGTTHTTHTVTVHRGGWNNGHGHVQRTVRTTHVNVIRGGQVHSKTVRRITTTRNVHGTRVTTHRVATDVHSYRRNFQAPRRYHWGAYHRPQGWYAHRWVYGERLPRAWYARDYFIVNFGGFGLIAPPEGYVWVRVGDDALLVDPDTGIVLRVVYGVFY